MIYLKEKSIYMKINYDQYEFKKEIKNALNFFILNHGSEEDKKDLLSDEKDSVGSIEVSTISLKPDPPNFTQSPDIIKRNRLKNIPEEQEDNSLHFFDLFDIVNMQCMNQFGLPNISINDLILNNVNKGFLVVNSKGKLINIITNKSANPIFIQNLINFNLENSIQKLGNSKIKFKHNFNNPFKINKPSPFN
jgi:hypothetical protein